MRQEERKQNKKLKTQSNGQSIHFICIFPIVNIKIANNIKKPGEKFTISQLRK